MLGKTFKGLTDEMLALADRARCWSSRPTATGHVVYVRPELVVEIAFDGVQAQPALPRRRGPALRPRQGATATDKRADEADTIETVRAIHAGTAPS